MAPSKSSLPSQPQPQSHDYYADAIPDAELLTPVPELAALFARHGVPQIPLLSPDKVRHFRRGHLKTVHRFNTSAFALKALGLPPSTDLATPSAALRLTFPWREDTTTIPVRDGTSIPARIYQPQPLLLSPLPVVLLFHGGGWFMGDLTTEAFLARLFAVRARCLVIDIGFRQYPDVPFGTPATDAHDAVRWAARGFGGDCRRGFVLAGVSGGATYAAVAAHLARDEHLDPPVTGQWLTCPVLPDDVGAVDKDTPTTPGAPLFDRACANRSQEHNAAAPLMNRAMQQGIALLTTVDFTSPLFTPFLFADHARLGEAGVYVQVAGMDPWRDSGRIYAGLCARAGSPVRVDVYSGLPHCWWQAFPHLKASEGWAADAVEGLVWLLRGSGKGELREEPGTGGDQTGVSSKL